MHAWWEVLELEGLTILALWEEGEAVRWSGCLWVLVDDRG